MNEESYRFKLVNFFISENMLYWGDEYLKTISKSDFDGNKRETFLDVGSVIGDIRMVGNYLYYTTVDNTLVSLIMMWENRVKLHIKDGGFCFIFNDQSSLVVCPILEVA